MKYNDWSQFIKRLQKMEEKLDMFFLHSKEVFNSVEAARFLGISQRELYKRMQSREIAYSKPGGKNAQFLRHDLLEHAARNRQKSIYELEAEALRKFRKRGEK